MLPATCSGLPPSEDAESITGTRSMVAKMEVAAARAWEKALREVESAPRRGELRLQRGEAHCTLGVTPLLWGKRVSCVLGRGREVEVRLRMEARGRGKSSSQSESADDNSKYGGNDLSRSRMTLYNEDASVEEGEGVCE